MSDTTEIDPRPLEQTDPEMAKFISDSIESGRGLHLSSRGVFVTGTQTRKVAKVGRNDPCPCGSGKKFKRCHGAN